MTNCRKHEHAWTTRCINCGEIRNMDQYVRIPRAEYDAELLAARKHVDEAERKLNNLARLLAFATTHARIPELISEGEAMGWGAVREALKSHQNEGEEATDESHE